VKDKFNTLALKITIQLEMSTQFSKQSSKNQPSEENGAPHIVAELFPAEEEE